MDLLHLALSEGVRLLARGEVAHLSAVGSKPAPDWLPLLGLLLHDQRLDVMRVLAFLLVTALF